MISQSYLKIDKFDAASVQRTGGVTGSGRVSGPGGVFYQLKPSILSAKFLRRAKASSTDRENFGEVISATVSRALTGSGEAENPELVPEVSLVYDDNKKEVLVASRYLKDTQEASLDVYASKRCHVKFKRHVKVSLTHNDPEKGILYLEPNNTLRKDLANALAVSILSGDHDVNPGNMMVVGHNDQHRIARIDFGHAFNDLLNAPKAFGGRVLNKANQVLDFLNRETLSNANPRERTPKLWRDYEGIVPSLELAAALKEMSQSENIEQGIENAKAQFSSLIEELNKDPKGNKKVLTHIAKSLVAINNNVSDQTISRNQDIKTVLENTFTNLKAFYVNGQNQMAQVANLMELQLDVDKFILSEQKDQDLQALQNSYKALSYNPAISNMAPIEWIKNDKNSKAFKGDLDAFIAHRQKQLEPEKAFTQDKTFALHSSNHEEDVAQQPMRDKKRSMKSISKAVGRSISTFLHFRRSGNYEVLENQQDSSLHVNDSKKPKTYRSR